MIPVATLPLVLPEAETAYNPWRESLENCIEGSNYLRASEYQQLIDELDRLYAIATPSDAALNDAYAEGRKDEREEMLSKLRDEFAAAAIMKLSTDWQPESAARLAYQLADAMLKEREA